MRQSIAIEGDGVAACCCTRLLQDSLLKVSVQRGNGSTPLTVLVSPGTQQILADVFGDTDVLSGYPVISKRVVLWGSRSTAVTIPHFGVAVSESSLVQRLWAKVKPADSSPHESPEWRLIAKNHEALSEMQRFGSRNATVVDVQLRPSADSESCWVESLSAGWLFLLASGCGRGSLISVGDQPSALLGRSRLVGLEVESLSGPGVKFAAYPRVAWPLSGPSWLACGSAAMGFDPLCGEGAGNAVREAILASAVMRAISKGVEPEQVLDHYSSRLLGGFLRHLESCEQFYSSAHHGAWWDAELDHLRTGIRWTRAQLSALLPVRYRLVNFDLEEVG